MAKTLFEKIWDRHVVETLADEFDLMEVALAAVKLAHEAVGGADDDEEIPQVGFRTDRDAGRGPGGQGAARGERPARRGPAGPTGRLFVGLGRQVTGQQESGESEQDRTTGEALHGGSPECLKRWASWVSL